MEKNGEKWRQKEKMGYKIDRKGENWIVYFLCGREEE